MFLCACPHSICFVAHCQVRCWIQSVITIQSVGGARYSREFVLPPATPHRSEKGNGLALLLALTRKNDGRVNLSEGSSAKQWPCGCSSFAHLPRSAHLTLCSRHQSMKEDSEDSPQSQAASVSMRTTQGASHPALAVLCDHLLLEQITDFMTGYPYAVGKLYQQHFDRQLISDKQVGNLRFKGLLVHIAVAASDPEMFKLLFKISRQPRYRDDWKLNFESHALRSFTQPTGHAEVYRRAETRRSRVAMGAYSHAAGSHARRHRLRGSQLVVRAPSQEDPPTLATRHDVPYKEGRR